jgi:hypothetical protein
MNRKKMEDKQYWRILSTIKAFHGGTETKRE